MAFNSAQRFYVGPQPYIPAARTYEPALGVSSTRLLNNSTGASSVASGPGGSDDPAPDSDSLAIILDPEMGIPPPR